MGLDDIDKNAELCLENDVVFAKYTSKASGDAVSTKEQEVAAKAQKDAESQEAVTSEPAPVEEVQQEAPAQQSAPAAAGTCGTDSPTDNRRLLDRRRRPCIQLILMES